MKVAHVLSTLTPGGAEILTLDFAKNIGSGINLSILYFGDGELFDEFKETKLKLIKIKKDVFFFELIFKIRRILLQEEIQILHIHSVTNPIPFILATFFTKIKIVITVHGYSLGKNKLLTRYFSGKVSRFLYVSESLKFDTLKTTCWQNDEKQKVHYNGIDPNKFIYPRYKFRYMFDNQDSSILMGMVGNFNTGRNQLKVCQALRKIVDKHISFKFVFVGAAQNHELYSECFLFCKENKLMDNIIFAGSRTDIPEFLSSLDLFVYASNHDTFGIAVVEAMMSGTAVIVNDLDVFKEITNDGKYACLYKSGDENDLYEKIIYYIQNQKERELLGEKGKEWAMNNFSIERYIKNLQLIYDDLI
ncbi:MAG: glycosyltransferase family 4 protein [Bacteroidota bacterium]